MNKDNKYQQPQDRNLDEYPEEGEYNYDKEKVEQELSQVASNPKQNIIILTIVLFVFLYVFYSFFLASDGNKDTETSVPIPTVLNNPSETESSGNIPAIPTLPSPPKLEDPTPPPAPPTQELDPVPPLDLSKPEASASAIPDIPVPGPKSLVLPSDITPSLPRASIDDEQEKARIKQKRTSSIVLVAGVPNTKTPEEIQQETDFKYRGDMNLILARGKLIDAVIETAVNTDIGGEIRAIVSSDVYSEWGKNILIPKGSKLFGSYLKGIDSSNGYGRVAIAWNRLDLINGYSLNFGNYAVAADNLGRAGVEGRVDNKFREQFSNAVLRSAFNIALANALDSVVKPTTQSQNTANQNTQASSIRNIANAASVEPSRASSERERVCSEVLNVITDKASTTFNTINKACQDLRTQTASTDIEKLASIKNTINSAADTLIQLSAKSAEATKAQKAAEDSFKDISDTIKKMIEQHEFRPTITLDQGTHIRIYVSRDFIFPKDAIAKRRRAR